MLTDVDEMSRKIDFDDWEITQPFFNFLNQKWGPYTIDCFADSSNTKLGKFYSKYFCPNTSGVNAFLYSWAGENSYLVPPVYLVSRAIKQLRYYKTRGTLVVPLWFSAAFWVHIHNDRNQFLPFVKDYMIVDNPRLCVRQGTNENCFIGSEDFNSKILALYIDFRC